MFKSTLITLGRILIILVVAGLIVAGLSLLTQSTAQAAPTGAPTSDQFSAGAPPAGGERPEGGEAGGFNSMGLAELAKNIGVIALFITVFWQIQKWTSHRRVPVLQA